MASDGGDPGEAKGAGGALPPPLHRDFPDPEVVWGGELRARCACPAGMKLWERRCPSCRTRNAFMALRGKRARLERFLDRQVSQRLLPEMEKARLLLDNARRYQLVLEEVARRPFPVRTKDEDLNRFAKRVLNFFPATLKAASPRQAALALSETSQRAATILARVAWTESATLLSEIVGAELHRPAGDALGDHAERVAKDMLALATPYAEALRTMQMHHQRLNAAFLEAKPILERDHQASLGKALWNKARSLFKSVGELVRFDTAIWKNDAEREALKRLDAELSRFLEGIHWFQEHTRKFAERHDTLFNGYRLSLRRHLIRGLTEHAATLDPADRATLVKRLRSQKGVGSALWRLFFGVK